MYIIYGKVYCGYCTKAKKFLEVRNIEYEYHDLDDYEDEFLTELKQKTNMQTIPIIFLDGDIVGGYTELIKSI